MYPVFSDVNWLAPFFWGHDMQDLHNHDSQKALCKEIREREDHGKGALLDETGGKKDGLRSQQFLAFPRKRLVPKILRATGMQSDESKAIDLEGLLRAVSTRLG